MKTIFVSFVSMMMGATALAQNTKPYPEEAIPKFNCTSGIGRYVKDAKGEYKEVDSESLQLKDIKPTYIVDPKGPISFPKETDLIRFQKFPIFTKAKIVIFWFSKGPQPHNQMQINLFGSYGNSADPVFPQPFPQPIATVGLKDPNWPLEQHMDYVYFSESMDVNDREFYSLYAYCRPVEKTPANRALNSRKALVVPPMVKVGNKFLPTLR